MKLTKEDIKKYGTEEEKKILSPELDFAILSAADILFKTYKNGKPTQATYDKLADIYNKGYAACKEEWEQSDLERSEWEGVDW